MVNKLIQIAIEEVMQQMMKEKGILQSYALNIALEHPISLEHGEYSSNIAMQLAKLFRQPPMQIANEFKERLLRNTSLTNIVKKIEAAAPGFLNFFINWQKWALSSNSEEIHGTPAGQKVVIEHTSINPNKSAHIGHLRNSCIGDTLARMLKKEGLKVEVHNYIDDLGNQLADTIVGIINTTTSREHERFGDFCWDIYSRINQAYMDQPTLLQERTRVLQELEEGRSNIAWIGFLTAERNVHEHVAEMKQFGISYDVLVWESSIVKEGFWLRTFDLLRATPLFQQEKEGKLKGCWVLKQTDSEIGDSAPSEYHTDKVLVRSNGILTYTAKDIAYHLWKFGLLNQDFRYKRFSDRLWTTYAGGVKRKHGHADMVINVIDQRQEYPQTMVKQALFALGFQKQAEQLKHVSYGVVSLSPRTARGLGIDTSDGRHAYAMSGRQGIGIKIKELLDQMEELISSRRSRKAGISSRVIAAASIRYYLLRYHLQTEIVFDLEQATEISGNTGVYLLYSYARACSLLEKSSLLSNQEIPYAAYEELDIREHGLLKQLAYWPEVRKQAANELAPNVICTYVYELSALFNHFYAACPILKAESVKRSFRIWLTEHYRHTMKDALEILGLPSPRKM